MKYTKKQIEEMGTLLCSTTGLCSEVPKMINKHGAETWEKCTAEQIVEFVHELSWGYKPNYPLSNQIANYYYPLSNQIANYYQRATISICLALLEILVEITNFKTDKWYDLLTAVTEYIDNPTEKRSRKVYSTISKFRKCTNCIIFDEAIDNLNGFHYGSCDNSHVDEIIKTVALFKFKGNIKQRREKASKFVADRLRQVVDPPTLKELRDIHIETKSSY